MGNWIGGNERFCPNCKQTVTLKVDWLRVVVALVLLLFLFGWIGLLGVVIVFFLDRRCPICNTPRWKMSGTNGSTHSN